MKVLRDSNADNFSKKIIESKLGPQIAELTSNLVDNIKPATDNQNVEEIKQEDDLNPNKNGDDIGII